MRVCLMLLRSFWACTPVCLSGRTRPLLPQRPRHGGSIRFRERSEPRHKSLSSRAQGLVSHCLRGATRAFSCCWPEFVMLCCPVLAGLCSPSRLAICSEATPVARFPKPSGRFMACNAGGRCARPPHTHCSAGSAGAVRVCGRSISIQCIPAAGLKLHAVRAHRGWACTGSLGVGLGPETLPLFTLRDVPDVGVLALCAVLPIPAPHRHQAVNSVPSECWEFARARVRARVWRWGSGHSALTPASDWAIWWQFFSSTGDSCDLAIYLFTCLE